MRSRVLSFALLWATAVLTPGCSLTKDAQRDEILFVRETEAGSAIFLMSPEGGDVRRLVSGTSPRWSPDGRRFAYLVDDGQETRQCGTSIWVMNPDTGTRRRITTAESGRLVCSLAWAPDGGRLAYFDGLQVVILNVKTGDAAVASLDAFADGPMDWSLDGRELILSVSFYSSHVLDLRTGAERGFGRPRAGDGRWSPDGERVALATMTSIRAPRIRRVLVLADSDGKNREQLTRGAFDSEPAWSPDGKRIYFSRAPASAFGDDTRDRSDLYRIEIESRTLERLTTNKAVDRLPDVRPSDRELPPVPDAIVGDVVVPDLVGRYVLLEDEARRFRRLGLTIQPVLLVPDEGVLAVIHDQVPRGGARVLRGTVVKITGSDLGRPLTSRRKFAGPAWRAHPGCTSTREWARFEMYSDVVRRVLRRGMTSKRVVSQLGEPQRSGRRWAGWALTRAPIRGTEPVCIYLKVDFDERGRALRFRQWAN